MCGRETALSLFRMLALSLELGHPALFLALKRARALGTAQDALALLALKRARASCCPISLQNQNEKERVCKRALYNLNPSALALFRILLSHAHTPTGSF